MSIASLGIIGGLATTSTAQRAADTPRVERDTTDQARQSASAEQAENAAGIGQTEEDSQTSERDADGRRLWERPLAAKNSPPLPTDSPLPPLSKDPTHSCGNQLDLTG
jgi:hypothetical protein